MTSKKICDKICIIINKCDQKTGDVIMEKIKIQTEYIKLDQFLKWTGVAESGVDAKDMILARKVKVNGEIEERRGKKLYVGDKVEVLGKIYEVE